jgi:hypothetical protein
VDVTSPVFTVRNEEDFKDAITILENGYFFKFTREININRDFFTDHTFKFDHEKVVLLAEALKKNKNEHVQILNMNRSMIDDTDACILAGALGENFQLRNIYVGSNHIGAVGRSALESVFPYNRYNCLFKKPEGGSQKLWGLYGQND